MGAYFFLSHPTQLYPSANFWDRKLVFLLFFQRRYVLNGRMGKSLNGHEVKFCSHNLNGQQAGNRGKEHRFACL